MPWGCGVADTGQAPAVVKHDRRIEDLRIRSQAVENLLSATGVFKRDCGVGADCDNLRVGLHDQPGALLQRQVLMDRQTSSRKDKGQEGGTPERERQLAANVPAPKQAHRNLRTTPFSTTSWLTSRTLAGIFTATRLARSRFTEMPTRSET